MSVQIDSIRYATTIEGLHCGACGIPFGVPINFAKSRKSDGKLFYCPNGCHIGFNNKDEIERLKGQLENERADRAYWREEYAKESRSHSATRGRVTKLKKRVAAGVCPCCTRTFQNLARHMAHQHPEYPEAT